jgi:chromosome segregation ATPase
MLRNKKMEAEKNLKEVLPKIIEYEHQINDLRINNEEYLNTIEEIREEMEAERDRCQGLEDGIKEYELRIEQLGQAYSAELHSK